MPKRTDRVERAVSAVEGGSGKSGRWALVAVTVVAVAALSLAGWLLVRPTPAETPSASDYSEAQRADAKTKVCDAYRLVSNGVSLNTNLVPPGGDGDATGSLAVVANARLALYDGGQYLLVRIDPATPSEMASEMRTFANNLMDIGAAATAGLPNSDPVMSSRLRDADALNLKIVEMCK